MGVLFPQMSILPARSNSALPCEPVEPGLPKVYPEQLSRCHWHICVVAMLLGVPNALASLRIQWSVSLIGELEWPARVKATASAPYLLFTLFSFSAIVLSASSQLIRCQSGSASPLGLVLRIGYFSRCLLYTSSGPASPLGQTPQAKGCSSSGWTRMNSPSQTEATVGQ